MPIGLSDMTRIHAETVWVTAFVLLAVLYTLWKSDAPARIQQSGRILLAAMVVQGMIGYTQYFTKLPAVLVGFHVVGATVVVTVGPVVPPRALRPPPGGAGGRGRRADRLGGPRRPVGRRAAAGAGAGVRVPLPPWRRSVPVPPDRRGAARDGAGR